MSRPQGAGRGWAAFSLIGIGLWVGAMVLVGVLSDDPADPGPTLIAFAAGGSLFFGLMFAAVLVQQLRRRPADPRGRFWKRVAIGYTLTGIVVTGLGLAAIWQQALGGGSVRIFIVPLVAIVAVWAIAAVLILRRVPADGAPQ
jgi:hypothetical protein